MYIRIKQFPLHSAQTNVPKIQLWSCHAWSKNSGVFLSLLPPFSFLPSSQPPSLSSFLPNLPLSSLSFLSGLSSLSLLLSYLPMYFPSFHIYLNPYKGKPFPSGRTHSLCVERCSHTDSPPVVRRKTLTYSGIWGGCKQCSESLPSGSGNVLSTEGIAHTMAQRQKEIWEISKAGA